MNISVVIPVYKNRELFFSMLENNVSILKNAEIIVVDDASGEQIGEEVQKKFPTVTVLINEKNEGFVYSVNRGIAAAKNRYILLINSDVKLINTHFLDNLSKFQENKKLFAISFMQIEKDGARVGKNSLYFKSGFFQHRKARDLTPGLNGWAEGGSCLIDKEKYNILNGLDSLYAPFYWEDIDLSYRAYRYGYEVEFNPECIVEHHHESTIGKYYDKTLIQTTAFRNQLLFMWKNMDDPLFFLEHCVFLVYNVLTSLIKGNKVIYRGFFNAVFYIPRIIQIRRSSNENKKRSMREIVGLFKQI